MWKNAYVLVFLLCFKPNLGHPQDDLGRQISQQVHDSLRGLEHLGSDIETNVQQQLRDAGIHNLGSRISADVNRQLAPLDNLGARIEEQVQRDLLPVYAMAIQFDMIAGVGGTTIATYPGKKPRSFIIKNGKRRVCNGTIKGSECDGALEPFKIDVANREDYCYSSSYAVVNNNICLSSGSLNIIANNNDITCNSADGSPTVIMTKKEFQDLCGDVTSRQIVYTYYADVNNPHSIRIPNSNPFVKCRNNQPGVCEFEANNGISSSFISSGNGISVGGGSYISTGNSYSSYSNF